MSFPKVFGLEGIVLRQIDLVELLLAQLVVVAVNQHQEDSGYQLNQWART